MASADGRIACPKCGANNFDTVTVCWKCNATLGSGSPALQMGASVLPTQTMNPVVASQYPAASQYPVPNPQFPNQAPTYVANAQRLPANLEYVPPQYSVPQAAYGVPTDGDAKMTKRAAIWLALTLPFIGLPVGWAFMMIQNRQRQEVGKLCVIWSLVALFAHVLLFGVAAASSGPVVLQALTAFYEKQNASGGAKGGGGAGGGMDANP